MSKERKILLSLTSLFFLYLIFRWVQIYSHPNPQDFHVYYFSAKTHSLGLNPYNSAEVIQTSDSLVRFPFVYPPYTLPVLKVLNGFDWKTSARLYLIFKTLLLIGLVLIWRKLSNHWSLNGFCQILAMISLGYYECVYRDFRHGNISTLEQFFLWSGVLFLTTGRLYLYAICIFFASFFKLALIPFLGVLLFLPQRKGWLPFLVGSGTFIGLQVSSYFLQPIEYQQFFSRASGLSEPGPLNPSSMMLARAFLSFINDNLANGVYVISALILSFFFLKKYWPRQEQVQINVLNFFIGFSFFYVLVMPRFKDYSFIMMIFPTYWVLNEMTQTSEKTKWFFVIAVVVHLFAYQSWLLVALLFYWWWRTSATESLNSSIVKGFSKNRIFAPGGN